MGRTFQVCSEAAAKAYYAANADNGAMFYLSPDVYVGSKWGPLAGQPSGWEGTGSPPVYNAVAPGP
jgi:hypothetical protein